MYFRNTGYVDVGYENHLNRPTKPIEWTPNLEHLKGHPQKTDHSHLDPLRGITIEHLKGLEISSEEDLGVFHQTSAEVSENRPVNAFCGNISIRYSILG